MVSTSPIEAPDKEGGLYKSEDQGKSFKQVSSNIGLVNRPFYYTNIELDPTNPDIIYATAWRAERKPWTIISGSKEDGIYKSTDGGDTWKKLEKGLKNS